MTTREEERRRLRRDLHDGLGPTLAALNLQAGAVRTLIPQDPDEATALVTEWRSTLRAVIADIRRLVYDLRPPALDELGLIGAIREQATQYSTSCRDEWRADADGSARSSPSVTRRGRGSCISYCPGGTCQCGAPRASPHLPYPSLARRRAPSLDH